MPYKDPKSPAAVESSRRAVRKYEQSHREERRRQKREFYTRNRKSEQERNREFKERMVSERRCVRCGKVSDHHSLCSACVPKQASANRRWLLNIKAAAFDKYGGRKCVCCGVDIFEFLTLDHIDGSGAKHRKELRGGDGYGGGGGARLYSWLKQQGYPAGYRVLCWNCNSAIGCYGYCPHTEPEKQLII